MILHALIYVEIGARRRIETSQEFIHDNKQLHICGLIDKLALSFCFEILYTLLDGELLRQVIRVKTQHLQIDLVFFEGLCIIFIADCICTQIAHIRCIGRNDRALLKSSALKYLIIFTRRIDGISNENGIAVTIHETRFQVKVLNDVPCDFLKTGAGAVNLLHCGPFLLELCLGSGRKTSCLCIKPHIDLIL